MMNKGFFGKKIDRVHDFFFFERRSGGQQNLISLSLLLLGRKGEWKLQYCHVATEAGGFLCSYTSVILEN